jgi:hypothetical protein
MHYDEAKGRLTIGPRAGQFKGMLRRRVFRVECVGSETPLAIGEKGKHTLVITYTGGEKELSLR